MSNFTSLVSFGWQHFFQRQLSLEEWDEAKPVRVVEQHKSALTVIYLSSESSEPELFSLPLTHSMPDLVVGDWILLNTDKQFIRVLDRKTCFSRKASGSKVKQQLISANVDTAFIVCSMNDDFNLNRIERFLSLVNDSAAEPVVVLSKSDLPDSPEHFVTEVRSLDPLLFVEPVNCLDPISVSKLAPWIKEGSTISVIGSSGVGKSTLINTLLGRNTQSTGDIREDDSKGRHTTTSRSLISLNPFGLILDTPGMREIQIADCGDGISATFADIESLSHNCRYGNCSHQAEPDCAVRAAIEDGELEKRRLENYLKLMREDAFNSASLAERREQDKNLGKFYKRTLKQSKSLKGR